MLILLTAMAVLLPLLAALQYYWLGQVSEGATQRLHSSLRARAREFRYDFNREFIRAYLNFHVDSFAPPDDIERFHVERFERWTETAPYPRLISNVFVVRYDEQGLSHLSQLDPKSKRLEPNEWTGENALLLARFERGERAQTNPRQASFDSFAEDIPALVVPFPVEQNQKTQGAGTALLPPGFTIIKLDLGYMQREFIPSLVKSHLFEDGQTEYDVAIVSLNNPAQVIYSSTFPAIDPASSDVSTRIFGLEADELRTFTINEATPATPDQPGPRRLINLRLIKRSSPDAKASSNIEDGRWQLLIKHQAGSLAAAVSSARLRNLVISFGILLLLGVGILMTAISTRRAQHLAQQQVNFVAGVTHELRTPLAVICSAGENLAHGIVDGPAKVAQYGDVIYREGRRLTDMVEQVLEFAGAQSGQQRYDFRPVNVAEVINRAVAACQSSKREFTIETSLEQNLPAVRGDAAALGRALQNLISNAIKYDGQNHWARISAEAPDSNEVLISVEDRGMGIDAKDVPHVFEPFYRGQRALAAQIEGSGVGLSLVKQIVEAHGGSINVKSTLGVGSTFMISLPKAV
jgi:signal transduction histidine kinase